MKKVFIKVVLSLFIIFLFGLSCYADDVKLQNYKYSIDEELSRCSSANFMTVGMNLCIQKGIDSWNKEIDKYLNLLKSVTTEEDYNNILKAQKDWETYKDSEFEAVSVIMEKQGTMFLNFTVGMKSALIKERALFLKEFYDTLSYKN